MNQQDHQLGYQPWVHGFAVSLVVATFLLVVLGGTVTSQGVGLAVPDWPTTFGYPMFGVPLAMWIGRGGVFWEHAHRLAGAAVGAMTIVLVELIWLGYLNHRVPFRLTRSWPWLVQGDAKRPAAADRPWLRWAAVGALVLVIVQGVMGGLRVTEMSTVLGILHGVTAQLFLCLLVLITAATSRVWLRATGGATQAGTQADRQAGQRLSVRTRRWSLALLAVLVVQLVLGAAMRHTGSRLAIPDFPSAYGGFVPPLSDASITTAIDAMPYEQFTDYYSPAQVGVHWSHRLWAVAVLAVAAWCITRLGRELAGTHTVDHAVLIVPALLLVALLVAQVALGVLVIWTGGQARNDQVATAHQALGAAVLAAASWLAIRVHVLRPVGRGSSRSAPTRGRPGLVLQEAIA